MTNWSEYTPNRVNYRTMPRSIAYLQPFTHGSAHATRTDTEYKVYSYETLILTVTLDPDASAAAEPFRRFETVTYFDARYYSRTTSRLQNIIRAEFPPSMLNPATRKED